MASSATTSGDCQKISRRGRAFEMIPQVYGLFGEPWWDRTTDPLIKSQVLYQLS
jgi:hypothetical protein